MEIKELKDCELKKVNDMYEEYISNHTYSGDSLDFINDFLTRCEYCGEIEFDSDLVEANHMMICEQCRDYLKDEEELQYNYEPDPYDEYVDRMLEEGEL